MCLESTAVVELKKQADLVAMKRRDQHADDYPSFFDVHVAWLTRHNSNLCTPESTQQA